MYFIVFFGKNQPKMAATSDMRQPGLLEELETPTITTPFPAPPPVHVAGTPEPYSSNVAAHQAHPSNLATLQPSPSNTAALQPFQNVVPPPPEALSQLHQVNAGGIPMLYTADGVAVAQFIPQPGRTVGAFAPPFQNHNVFQGIQPSQGALQPGVRVFPSQFIPQTSGSSVNPFARPISSHMNGQEAEANAAELQSPTDDNTPPAYHSGKGNGVLGIV